jgi:hypothetical protein
MINLKPQPIGAITALLMIAISLFAFYGLKLPVENKLQYLVYAVFCGGILWALFGFKNFGGGDKTFKEYFSTGFKCFVVVVLLMAVYTFVFFSFNTAFRDAKIAENTKLIIEQGNHLPNEIEENNKKLRQLFMPIMVSSAVFRYLIIGAIVSVVGAGFLSAGKKAG